VFLFYILDFFSFLGSIFWEVVKTQQTQTQQKNPTKKPNKINLTVHYAHFHDSFQISLSTLDMPWNCEACTFVNCDESTICEICDTSVPINDSILKAAAALASLSKVNRFINHKCYSFSFYSVCFVSRLSLGLSYLADVRTRSIIWQCHRRQIAWTVVAIGITSRSPHTADLDLY